MWTAPIGQPPALELFNGDTIPGSDPTCVEVIDLGEDLTADREVDGQQEVVDGPYACSACSKGFTAGQIAVWRFARMVHLGWSPLPCSIRVHQGMQITRRR